MNSRPASRRTWPFCRRSAAERRNGRRDDGPRRPREAGAATRREPAAEDRERGVEREGDRPLRLGLSTGWMSLLGDDEAGRLVLDRVQGEGVDTSRVRRVQGFPTGLYLREQVGREEARVYYYRGSSAASTMAPGAFDTDYLEDAKCLHLAGITPSPLRRLPGLLHCGPPARPRPFSASTSTSTAPSCGALRKARGFVEEILPRRRHPVRGRRESRGALGGATGLSCGSSQPRGRRRWCSSGEGGSLALVDSRVAAQPPFPCGRWTPSGPATPSTRGILPHTCGDYPPEERLRTANAMGALSVATLGDFEGCGIGRSCGPFIRGRKDLGR